jgi:hypothetical protein
VPKGSSFELLKSFRLALLSIGLEIFNSLSSKSANKFVPSKEAVDKGAEEDVGDEAVSTLKAVSKKLIAFSSLSENLPK